MAIINATNVVIKVALTEGGTPTYPLVHCTSASLSISREMIDSTTKSSQGWSESLPGLKSWEISGDGFADVSVAVGAIYPDSIVDRMLEANPICEVQFEIDSVDYTGSVYINSVSIDGGVEENATYSISMTGTSTLTTS